MNTPMRPFCARVLVTVAVAGPWSTVAAAPINYGDFSDIPPGTVIYLDVTETANTPGDSEPLFGPPTIKGNQLDFDPAGFTSSATSGAADLTDGQLNVTLTAGVGWLRTISISERGDYTLFGSGSGATQVGYGVSIGGIRILEVDGSTLSTPVALSGASASGSDSLSGGTDFLSPWSLGLTYDVEAALAATSLSYDLGVTKLEIVIDNLLTSISEPSTIAYIAKKDFTIAATTQFQRLPLSASANVPVPGAFVLLVSGCVGLAATGRRTRRRRNHA